MRLENCICRGEGRVTILSSPTCCPGSLGCRFPGAPGVGGWDKSTTGVRKFGYMFSIKNGGSREGRFLRAACYRGGDETTGFREEREGKTEVRLAACFSIIIL